MYKYACLNQISQVGLDRFTDQYIQVEEIKDADAVLVRSAKLHDMEFPDLEKMYKLSEIYHVPIEELMQVRTQTLEEGLKGVHKTLIRFIGYVLGFSIYGIYILSYIVMFAGGIWAMLIWAEVPKAILQMVAGD